MRAVSSPRRPAPGRSLPMVPRAANQCRIPIVPNRKPPGRRRGTILTHSPSSASALGGGAGRDHPAVEAAAARFRDGLPGGPAPRPEPGEPADGDPLQGNRDEGSRLRTGWTSSRATSTSSLPPRIWPWHRGAGAARPRETSGVPMPIDYLFRSAGRRAGETVDRGHPLGWRHRRFPRARSDQGRGRDHLRPGRRLSPAP